MKINTCKSGKWQIYFAKPLLWSEWRDFMQDAVLEVIFKGQLWCGGKAKFEDGNVSQTGQS